MFLKNAELKLPFLNYPGSLQSYYFPYFIFNEWYILSGHKKLYISTCSSPPRTTNTLIHSGILHKNLLYSSMSCSSISSWQDSGNHTIQPVWVAWILFRSPKNLYNLTLACCYTTDERWLFTAMYALCKWFFINMCFVR